MAAGLAEGLGRAEQSRRGLVPSSLREERSRFLQAGSQAWEIADRLVVSAATIKTHVNHIFAKAGVRDRAQAVVYAYESGFVRAGSG